MSPEMVGIGGFFLLFLLFFLGMPIGFAMAISGLVGFAYLVNPEAALGMLATDVFQQLISYPLTVIPMFILMGNYAFASGISERLYRAAHVWVGRTRGGLAMATVLASAAFGAICGSTVAGVATFGRIALPEMKRYKYDDVLSTGTIAAAGNLAGLIPPSFILIIYGILTEQSIGRLFVATILPGLLTTGLFAATIALWCKVNPNLAPVGTPTSIKAKLKAFNGLVETLILFAFAMGGLFMGWFSATQAGAIGAAGALIIGVARRNLTWKAFWDSTRDGLRTSCMVMFILVGALIFGHFITVTQIPVNLARWVEGQGLPPILTMCLILLIYFIGGFVMDMLALIVLTIPIIYPVVMRIGFDPIWFGIAILLTCSLGVLTPPVGLHVFVLKGVAPDIPIEVMFKGVVPFIMALIVALAIVLAFPQLATFLPGLMYR
jgi:C4-dicarboxylate transporter, DctM subunit